MQRPRVTLRGLHYRYQGYFDWIITGFAMLAGKGVVEFKAEPLQITRPFQWHPRAAGAFRRFFPRLEKELRRGDDWCIEGEVCLGDKVVRFALDVDDSPFLFQVALLESTDLYFKCQHPA